MKKAANRNSEEEDESSSEEDDDDIQTLQTSDVKKISKIRGNR